jgi:hypothetical protein
MFRAVASAEVATDADVKGELDLKSLANWETRVYQYDRTSAADFGFTMGSVKATAGSRLLVMDTTRSKAIKRGDHTELWGCGYRFQIEVSDIGLTTKLTLPAIAAAMEVTALEASVRLEVKGYTGDEMWSVIPSPKPLDVDTYRTYMEAVERIQKAFAQNPDSAVPVLLAEGTVGILEGGISAVDVDSAVLVVWALKRLSRGASLDAAAADLATDGPTALGDSAAELLARTYESILGTDDSTTEPNEEAMARAGSYLETLELR